MKLAIPELKPVTDKKLPQKVKQVNQWLVEAKELDAGARIKAFYQLLKKINRANIPPKEHVEILEALRPMAQHCVGQLHKRYIALKLPLSDKALPVYRLALTITDEMALGYKLVLQRLIDKPVLFGASRMLLSCNRAMTYLSELLLSYSEIYIQPSKTVWQDLNALYLKSLELQIQDKKVPDALNEKAKFSTEDTYKKVCLFSISNAYSLRKGESKKLFHLIDTWIDKFQIKESVTRADINYFIVDISSNSAPEMSDKTRLSENLLRHIVLDDLKEYLDTVIQEELHTEILLIQGEKLNVTAMKRLQKNWVKRKDLRVNRKTTKTQIIVEIGLKHINDQIIEDLVASDDPFADTGDSDDFDFDALSGTPEVKEEYQLLKQENGNDDDEKIEWRLVDDGNVICDDHEKEATMQRAERDEKRKQQVDDKWQIKNVSGSGYSLYWHGKSKQSAHVGEVIGLRIYDQISAEWNIAVIRWIQYRGENSLEIGVQSISKQVISAKAKRADGVQQSAVLQYCLFIPEDASIKQPFTIIVPSFMYRVEEELILSYNGIHQGIRLDQMYDHTGSYTQFAVSPIKLESDKKKEVLEQKNADEFSTLWDDL